MMARATARRILVRACPHRVSGWARSASYSPSCLEKLFGKSEWASLRVPQGGKTRRAAPLLPLCATENTRSRPLQLFTKQFQKRSSRKPGWFSARDLRSGHNPNCLKHEPPHYKNHHQQRLYLGQHDLHSVLSLCPLISHLRVLLPRRPATDPNAIFAKSEADPGEFRGPSARYVRLG
jgi:hypothetical protein